MTGHPIEPSGTAADRVAAQEDVIDKMPVEMKSELDRMRAASAKIRAEGVGLNTLPDDLSIFIPDADSVAEESVVSEPEAQPLSFDICTSFVFQMDDGREIEMGPPPVPHMLFVPKMFADRKDLNPLQAEAEIKFARVMSYVRRVGNQRLALLQTWAEVVKLGTELGEFGCRAAYEVYAENWSDYTATGWKMVKKSVSSKNSAKQSG